MFSKKKFSTKKLSKFAFGLALAAGMSLSVAPELAQARYFDAETQRWYDERPQDRKVPLHRRKPHSKFNKRKVAIQTKEKPGTVIIHTDEKFLYYVTGKNRAIRYGVGVGREGFGWNGIVKIKRKEEWPTWIPPKEMIQREKAEGRTLPARMEGGEKNPLGARAMYLFKGGRDTLYRIHGTNQPWSIGLNLSSGCIRMMNKDVEDLYKRVDLGTKVIVIGPGERSSKYFTEVKNPLAILFGGG